MNGIDFTFGLEHALVTALLVLFLLKRLLATQVAIIANNYHFINLCFFLLIAIFLSYQFWIDELYTGIFAIFLGCLAFGKYYYDVSQG